MYFFNKKIKLDENACRCFNKYQNGPKLWVYPFNITKDYVYNFLNEHDKHILDIYRETIIKSKTLKNFNL